MLGTWESQSISERTRMLKAPGSPGPALRLQIAYQYLNLNSTSEKWSKQCTLPVPNSAGISHELPSMGRLGELLLTCTLEEASLQHSVPNAKLLLKWLKGSMVGVQRIQRNLPGNSQLVLWWCQKTVTQSAKTPQFNTK